MYVQLYNVMSLFFNKEFIVILLFRFCVGDRFYLCENKILCQYDYEERMIFANMTQNAFNLARIQRQVNNLQVGL